MSILVTGFTGKVGFQVAQALKDSEADFICGVRNVERVKERNGNTYEFVTLDFGIPETFPESLNNIDRIFLMYPPGENLQFEEFISQAKAAGVKHIVYLSVKDVQFMPFIHHYRMEKLIKKSEISYTFIRAGYFMQNLNDFLCKEIRERKRIFVPAGKGKTSFVDTRDIAEVAALSLTNPAEHQNKKYVITGDQSLDFYEVADIMTEVIGVKIEYTNPSVKEFKEFMNKTGEDESMANVVVGVHFPTKLGLAKRIKHDFEKVTGKKPRHIAQYIEDFKGSWV
ncbi:SDR family oxidoreductase [Rossellomorea vietnamensis]|uniref:SDR family oxidoreductase n=1 Tax=Rossellomorea vietnamensis TaxID=218284 RepID=A0A5D4MJR6_9BACI|nr:SDR family oxidoreductase [Rossellomorea vietnamensis]TYS01226.1 SDR family oxidoreductase [Rossellomorea vietnamensis]